jgi:hypothetical protein
MPDFLPNFAPEEHAHNLHRHGYYQSPARWLDPYWVMRMTPQQRHHQITRQLSRSWVIGTWVILLGITGLVIFGYVWALISAR